MAENALKTSGSTKDALQSLKKRKGQLLAIVLLFFCCAASFYFYMNTMKIISDGGAGAAGSAPPMPDVTTASESHEIETTGAEFASMGKATSLVIQTALLAEVSGKFPIALASAMEPPRLSGSLAESAETQIQLEPEPPQVTVVALLLTGKDRIAMLDIMGEGSGLVMKQGSSFAGGSAKITKIDEKGVTFRWMKKNYTVTM